MSRKVDARSLLRRAEAIRDEMQQYVRDVESFNENNPHGRRNPIEIRPDVFDQIADLEVMIAQLQDRMRHEQ